jgi:branched-chain amino acid transport system ATP-binding protein
VSAAGLSATGLSLSFGGVHAVRGVSLETPEGQLTALIGRDGAGKTTTFNALCGLNKPSAGRTQIFGPDISRLAPRDRAQ